METTPETLARRLGNVRHFMNLPVSDRLAVIRAGQIRIFPSQSVIFREHEPCAGMFVLLSGHVHLCKLSIEGQLCIVDIVNPVIMFNEVALLDGGSNPFTAVAEQHCVTWHISRESYLRLLDRLAQDEYAKIAIGLLDIMARRHRQLLESYSDLTFLTVPIRVAKLIYELSDNGSMPIDRQNVSISEMAARISTVPEAISRSLQFLRCQGIIRTNRTTITVLQPDELAILARVRDTRRQPVGEKA